MDLDNSWLQIRFSSIAVLCRNMYILNDLNAIIRAQMVKKRINPHIFSCYDVTVKATKWYKKTYSQSDMWNIY